MSFMPSEGTPVILKSGRHGVICNVDPTGQDDRVRFPDGHTEKIDHNEIAEAFEDLDAMTAEIIRLRKITTECSEVCRDRDALKAEVGRYATAITESRAREKKLNETVVRLEASANHWVWQGDGTDRLETLTCSVLIRPEALKAMVDFENRIAEIVAASNNNCLPIGSLSIIEVVKQICAKANDRTRAARNAHEAYNRLYNAILAHHDQKADDRCIEDDTRLYAAAGLPPADHRVGDKFEMLKNCARFIEKRCEGGTWPTYAELEQKVTGLRELIAIFQDANGKAIKALEAAGCGKNGKPNTLLAMTQEIIKDRDDQRAAGNEAAGKLGETQAKLQQAWVENNRLRADMMALGREHQKEMEKLAKKVTACGAKKHYANGDVFCICQLPQGHLGAHRCEDRTDNSVSTWHDGVAENVEKERTTFEALEEIATQLHRVLAWAGTAPEGKMNNKAIAWNEAWVAFHTIGRQFMLTKTDLPNRLTKGVVYIACERWRQIHEEGWTAEHDDQHACGELAQAAACYALPTLNSWPWDKDSDKRGKHSRIRQLEIAGALIAAEIDRLQRAADAPKPG